MAVTHGWLMMMFKFGVKPVQKLAINLYIYYENRARSTNRTNTTIVTKTPNAHKT